MANPVDDQSPGAPAFARCAECSAALAHDQRYCVACGARRGGLAAAAAAIIAAGGPAAPAGVAAVAGATALGPDPRFRLPGARAAAAAVMAVLGFGVVVGSAVTPVQTGTPAAVALIPQAAAPAAAPAAAAPLPVVDVPATTPPVDTNVAATPTDSGSGDDSGSSASEDKQAPAATDPDLPAVKHVFLIVLSGQGFEQSFGRDSTSPYLSKTLAGKGELLADYSAVAQGELANEIALVSGQGPTMQTDANCPTFADVAPGTVGKDGQVAGDGCAYPLKTQTIADQLTADGRSWKAYLQGYGVSSLDPNAACRRPAPGVADPEHDPRPQDGYVTWRNPFAYFHSIADGEGCGNETDLGDLARDLKLSASTPSLAFIVPDRCHDGNETPCSPGAPAGLAASDDFLREVVPAIEASPGYKDGGLIALTFDQAPQTGPHADSSSCCDQPVYPNLPAASAPRAATPAAQAQAKPEGSAPEIAQAPVDAATERAVAPDPAAVAPAAAAPAAAAPDPAAVAPDPAAVAPDPAAAAVAPDPDPVTPVTPPTPADPGAAPAAAAAPPAAAPPAPTAGAGGGKVGLLLISSFVKAGTVNRVNAFNHYSLLRSLEDLFGLDHLGYAADPALPAFDKAVYNASKPTVPG